MTPSLSISYLAAALLHRGHEVEVFDCQAPYGPPRSHLVERISSWKPDLVGVGLYADFATLAYRLLRELPMDHGIAVAGGPHATAVPEESLGRGFDVAVIGEGEETIAALADLVEGGPPSERELGRVRGIAFREGNGAVRRTPPRPRLEDLDALPAPHEGAGVFPRDWYLLRGEGSLPASLVTSRGCEGACTFCANLVGGRRRRNHSLPRVLAELGAHVEREGPTSVTFHDDAFTADRERFLALTEALRRDLPRVPPWWCQTRVDRFDEKVARSAKGAGCHTVVFGMESGHPETLRRIGKGIRPEQSLRAARFAHEVGLGVYANFMLGFPFEEVDHVRATLRLMERLAPHVQVFSSLGILTPYPGTEIYRRHADRCGFREWWLDEDVVERLYAPLPPGGFAVLPRSRLLPVLARMEEALLEVDFFGYAPDVRSAIRDCLAFRRDHNGPHFEEGDPA
jgi:radical SAM superfamily enzyme YgiQ (UPF0313 family)